MASRQAPNAGAAARTLRRSYDAFATQDIATVMAGFNEDIVWEGPDSVPFGGRYEGHDGVGNFFGQLPQHFQELHVEPQEFIDGGEYVVVLVNLRGTEAGGSLDSKSAHVWKMRDGRASSFREYPDTARVLEAIGS